MVFLEVLLGHLGSVCWGIVMLEPYICKTFTKKKLLKVGISTFLRISKKSASFTDLSHLISSLTPALELTAPCFIVSDAVHMKFYRVILGNFQISLGVCPTPPWKVPDTPILTRTQLNFI